MKSKDLQDVVLSKYKNGDRPAKIFKDLNGAISRNQVYVWCPMVNRTGAIQLSNPPGYPRVIRTKNLIQKVKRRLKRNKNVSSRKLALELDVSRTNIRRILKDDLGCHAFKKRIEPLITNAQKEKRRKFANWMRTNFKKEQTLKFVFSDEKIFDLN